MMELHRRMVNEDDPVEEDLQLETCTWSRLGTRL